MRIGMLELLKSTKGTLSILIVGMSFGLCATGKLDSTAFAAIVATVATIFNYTRMKTDISGEHHENK